MKIKGRLVEVSFSFGGKPRLTIETSDRNALLAGFDELHEHEVVVEIKRYSPRRSLDANAYCFVLIDKIAEKLNISKEEVYREAIKHIGGVSDTVCVKDCAVETLTKAWQSKGLGWQTETFKSKIAGCTNVVLYYGSSVYDTKQMSALIDHIVQDCKALGIETKTPAEIMLLNER